MVNTGVTRTKTKRAVSEVRIRDALDRQCFGWRQQENATSKLLAATSSVKNERLAKEKCNKKRVAKGWECGEVRLVRSKEMFSAGWEETDRGWAA
jgi:hypothetical protein